MNLEQLKLQIESQKKHVNAVGWSEGKCVADDQDESESGADGDGGAGVFEDNDCNMAL
jgi:hypothetical protein